MKFASPQAIYRPSSNIEAHMIVEMLTANGIESKAIEDVSGASLFSLGILTQFHNPKIYVDKPDAEAALKVLETYEQTRRDRDSSSQGTETEFVTAVCEECGQTTEFPLKLNGTTQDCSHCGSYVDVGDLEWDEDYDAFEEPVED